MVICLVVWGVEVYTDMSLSFGIYTDYNLSVGIGVCVCVCVCVYMCVCTNHSLAMCVGIY